MLGQVCFCSPCCYTSSNIVVIVYYRISFSPSEFQSVLLFRHQHKMRIAFDKSDIYVICRMKPLTFDITLCQEEIAKCEWMDIADMIQNPDSTALVKVALRLILKGMNHGFENVDITVNEMKSWIDPTRTFKLYHRPLPT